MGQDFCLLRRLERLVRLIPDLAKVRVAGPNPAPCDVARHRERHWASAAGRGPSWPSKQAPSWNILVGAR
jgi:hypothetical protein